MVQNGSSVIKQRELQIEFLQDLDECWLQARNLQAVLDAPNEAKRVDFGAHILQQAANECRPGLCVLEQILPQFIVILLLCEVDGLVGEWLASVCRRGKSSTHLFDIIESLDDQHQGPLVVSHSTKKENHLRNEVFRFAHLVCLKPQASVYNAGCTGKVAHLFKFVIAAHRTQEAHQLVWFVLGI